MITWTVGYAQGMGQSTEMLHRALEKAAGRDKVVAIVPKVWAASAERSMQQDAPDLVHTLTVITPRMYMKQKPKASLIVVPFDFLRTENPSNALWTHLNAIRTPVWVRRRGQGEQIYGRAFKNMIAQP
jgi:hypothetical protein